MYLIRDYRVPPYVDEKTLVVGISYSGNTEETLAAFGEAQKRCPTLAITSGGKLATLAGTTILIPAGMQPRAALAYLLFPLARILSDGGFVDGVNLEETRDCIHGCRERFERLAREVADDISGVPIIYGYGIMESVARRFRQQLNENAKMPACDFFLTECNHNEIEAWECDVPETTCIFLRDADEPDTVRRRFSFMREVYGKKARVIEVFGEGESSFSRAVSLMFLGDLVSVLMAERRGVEAEPVNLIARLKETLAQHSRSSS
jgi:glucose/mannose-6-phosphate isomerase